MNQMTKSSHQLHTVADLLDYAHGQFEQADLFYGHGADNAWDEAVFLVLRTLDLPPDSGEEVLDHPVTANQRERLLALIERRVRDKVPAAYLINEAWFCGQPYYVDERVLVPRSPIAECIEQGFEPWLTRSPQRILDLCTGSACIAIACAHAFPMAQVIATDLSADALAVAKINVEKHGVQDRVQLIESDLFDQVAGPFDLIVSNPPYVGSDEIARLPQEYTHEPGMGLAGGDDDGLALVAQMLEDAPNYLNSMGVMVVEVGNSDEAMMKRYPNLPLVWLEFERGGHGVFVIQREQLL